VNELYLKVIYLFNLKKTLIKYNFVQLARYQIVTFKLLYILTVRYLGLFINNSRKKFIEMSNEIFIMKKLREMYT